MPLVESVFEYGSRRGAWRLLDIFAEHSVAVSILGVVRALEQNPELAKACVSAGTRSSATAIAGSTMSMCPRRSSASTSAGRSKI